MVVKNIFTYPLKSSKAIALEGVDIISTGILYDRSIIVLNKDDKAITGREFPQITTLTAAVQGKTLQLTAKNGSVCHVVLPSNDTSKVIKFKLFRNTAVGLLVDVKASTFIGEILGIDCSLVFVDTNFRPIHPNRGGKKEDLMGYADASPLHLINEATLKFLNSKLVKKVSPLHFRPNLVVNGGNPFDEDTWKRVVINGCQFEVQNKCKRCIFTTIDPTSALRDDNIEPLTTLAHIRKERNEELNFGIYLIPRKIGEIRIGDTVLPN